MKVARVNSYRLPILTGTGGLGGAAQYGGGGAGSVPWSYAQADGGLAGDGTTDDTAALQTWIDTVTASGTCSGWFFFEPGVYLIGGSLQDTGAFNGQILLPDVSTSDPQITLTFQGAARPPFAYHGTAIDDCYSVIKTSLTGASGTAAVFSGGNSGQNNVQVVILDVVCLAPDNPTFTFWNLKTTQGGVRNGLMISTTGIISGASVTEPTNSNAYGVKLPTTNNSNHLAEDLTCVYGFFTGVLVGELTFGNFITSLTKVGLEVGTTPHPGGVITHQMTASVTGIAFTGGDSYIDIWYDAEHCNPSAGGPYNPSWAVTVNDIEDASDFWHGHARWFGVEAGVGPDHLFTVNGAANALYEEIGQPPAGATGGTPATTVTDETTFGITPAVGTDTEYARQDHTHGSPDDAELQVAGHYELLMTGSGPPEPIENGTSDDWLYVWVPA